VVDLAVTFYLGHFKNVLIELAFAVRHGVTSLILDNETTTLNEVSVFLKRQITIRQWTTGQP